MANFTQLVPGHPLFMENLTGGAEIKYSAAEFRAYTTAFHRTSGVLGPTDFRVTQADNIGFSIKVAAGSALVGSYVVVLPTDLTISLPFSQNPGTTCVHKVYLLVNDEAYDANTVGYEAHIQGMESVNGAVPPVPTFSAGYIELCSITYKPGQPNVQNKDIVNTAASSSGGGGSGPINMVPASGIVSLSNIPLRCAYSNGRVVLSGAVGRSNGGVFTGGYTTPFAIATLPTGYRPKAPRVLIGAAGPYGPQNIPGLNDEPGPYMQQIRIDPDGRMAASLPPGGNPYFLYFDGMSFDLD